MGSPYKVIKTTRGKDILDSTHSCLSKAITRAQTLRASLRGMKTEVKIVPTDGSEPKRYRKPNNSRGY